MNKGPKNKLVSRIRFLVKLHGSDIYVDVDGYYITDIRTIED